MAVLLQTLTVVVRDALGTFVSDDDFREGSDGDEGPLSVVTSS